MKKSSSPSNHIFAAFLLLVAVAASPAAAASCDVQNLAPCLNAFTVGAPPSSDCCQSLIRQKPCFCGYIHNPSLGSYINSPAARNVIVTCRISMPKC